MLVTSQSVNGTIGGGHLEWQALARARARLQQGAPAPEDISVALGPSLGQCCGGSLTLRHSTLDAQTLARWAATPPRFQLQLFGAGHVGRAIVRALHGIDADVRWIDTREEALDPATVESLRDASGSLQLETVWSDPITEEVHHAVPGQFFLVLTHSHALDLALTEHILRRADFGFFGLIGSATKRAQFERRLRDKGFSQAALDRITCPIGLPDISGKEPAVIAVSVVAQLLSRSAPPENR
jgi:xanthine dehydrogenase accessory factor